MVVAAEWRLLCSRRVKRVLRSRRLQPWWDRAEKRADVIRGAMQGLARALEPLLWGGRRRERALIWLLGRHYASLMRRQWVFAPEPPHFFDHRLDAFALVGGGAAPSPFYRAYFAAELLREADVVLDIGCGGGYFTSRFFAPRCAQVDGIDIEADAIEHAEAVNPAPNVTFLRADAVEAPFPRGSYDVVVWDGAIGHFPPDTTARVLEKVRDVLAPEGAFVGSESLGQEGHDHLQFFATTEDLAAVLRPHFTHVAVRELSYSLPDGSLRREVFWRCAQDPVRLRAADWHYSGQALEAGP
jgi:SAM-dependent methyltransferase